MLDPLSRIPWKDRDTGLSLEEVPWTRNTLGTKRRALPDGGKHQRPVTGQVERVQEDHPKKMMLAKNATGLE